MELKATVTGLATLQVTMPEDVMDEEEPEVDDSEEE